MTEAEWLACDDPAPLLAAAWESVSARKLRLFACACCHKIADKLSQAGQEAVAVAEQFADGVTSDAVRRAALRALVIERGGQFVIEESGSHWATLSGLDFGAVAVACSMLADNELLIDHECGRRIAGGPTGEAWEQAAQILECSRLTAAMGAFRTMNERVEKRRAVGRIWNQFVRSVVRAVDGYWPWESPKQTEYTQEYIVQAAILRDIFGNQYRPVAFSPEWRTDTAVTLARQMYEGREFGAMPILADALQDAGCDSAEILDHCRDIDATHVRGCWVCDALLGKE